MANANKTLLCIASALALAACASDEHRQVAELSRAHTLVEQAQQAGAQQYAGADLEAANNKLPCEWPQRRHSMPKWHFSARGQPKRN
jgi:hypothetical protein